MHPPQQKASMSAGCFHTWVVTSQPGARNGAVESLCALWGFLPSFLSSWCRANKPFSEPRLQPTGGSENLGRSCLFPGAHWKWLHFLPVHHVLGAALPTSRTVSLCLLIPFPAVLLFPLTCMSSSHLYICDFCAFSSGCLPQHLEDVSYSHQPGIAVPDSIEVQNHSLCTIPLMGVSGDG